jgi:hypothetical protein
MMAFVHHGVGGAGLVFFFLAFIMVAVLASNRHNPPPR